MTEMGLHRIPVMRAALVAIQEQHPPVDTFDDGTLFCEHCHVLYPCATRRLADQCLEADHG